MDTIHTIGRRKAAVARIYLSKGKGDIIVNGKDFRDYFPVLILSLALVAGVIISKLVRDAAAVIRLEKNPRAKRPRSKSVEIIHRRRPRQSVVQRQKIEDIV